MTQDLPIIVLDNYGDGPLDTGASSQFGSAGARPEFVDAMFMQFGGSGGPVSLSSTPDIATRSGIHVRGQSTASFDKTVKSKLHEARQRLGRMLEPRDFQ